MRYKVGDKVRIREDLYTIESYNIVPSMYKYRGKIAIINIIYYNTDIYLDIDDQMHFWLEEWLEPYSKWESITI